MKGCELCDRAARMFCESDQAILCWECDAKVHGANFLVARHTRVLLCRRCQAQTPWKASGTLLSPIVSSCESCVAVNTEGPASVEEEADEDSIMDDVDDAEDDDNSDAEEEEAAEEEGDYQVVPWTLTPPPLACSSSGEESSSQGKETSRSLRRIKDNADLGSKNDSSCLYFKRSHLHQSTQAPFLAESTAREHSTDVFTSFLPSNDCSLHQDAPPSAANAGSGNRVRSRRLPFAVHIGSSSSNPPI